MKKFVFIVLHLFILSTPLQAETHSTLNILFIGNSLTYYNSLPSMFEALANDDHKEPQNKPRVKTEMVTIGGANLKQHWSSGRALNAIKKGGWDYVVLQEQSALGYSTVNGERQISNPKTFHMFASLFDAEIKKSGAKTALMLTWADQSLTADQMKLNKAFVDVAQKLNAQLIPVGPVWQSVSRKMPNVELFTDSVHPFPVGSYISASVLYAHLLDDTILGKPGTVVAHSLHHTGISKSEKPETLVDISDEIAYEIQKFAVKSVKAMPVFLASVKNFKPKDLSALVLPTTDEDFQKVAGEWAGKLLFFNDPATLTLNIYREGNAWKGDQNILLENGDRLSTSHVLYEQDGKLLWVDQISNTTFTAVYTGNTLVGHVKGVRTEYGEPGSRFGSWVLKRQ